MFYNMTIKEIIDTDEFCSLTSDAQRLYFFLFHNSYYGATRSAHKIARANQIKSSCLDELVKLKLIDQTKTGLWRVDAWETTVREMTEEYSGEMPEEEGK